MWDWEIHKILSPLKGGFSMRVGHYVKKHIKERVHKRVRMQLRSILHDVVVSERVDPDNILFPVSPEADDRWNWD